MARSPETDRAATSPDAPAAIRPRRSALLGAIAGLIGIGCCVYPVTLALLGLSSAAAAVDLANTLFDEWGWAFKAAGAAFALGALWIQRRRARACPVGPAEPHANGPVGGGDGAHHVRGLVRVHDVAREPRPVDPT
jgi:hypothetical protein